jgi:DNA-binding NarL/FixJ family response regulator
VRRVAVFSDQAVTRAGLVALLERGGMQVVVSGTTAEPLDDEPGAAAEADVVLLHLTGQTDAWRSVLAHLPSTPVVVLLDDVVDADRAARTLDAGARVVLARDATEEEIVAAIDAAAVGLIAMSARLAEPMLARRDAHPSSIGPPEVAPQLTPRERQVLGMVAEGLPNKIIAARLGISEHTVKTHLAALFEKLGVSTRAEAVARGARLGLLLL